MARTPAVPPDADLVASLKGGNDTRDAAAVIAQVLPDLIRVAELNPGLAMLAYLLDMALLEAHRAAAGHAPSD